MESMRCLTWMGCLGALTIAPAGYGLELTTARPEITLTMPTAQESSLAARFIRVHVVRITNARRSPISITVLHRDEAGGIRTLGMFSPFPADNPGTFLVPIQAGVIEGGLIVLRLSLLEPGGPDDDIGVSIGGITLTDGESASGIPHYFGVVQTTRTGD